MHAGNPDHALPMVSRRGGIFVNGVEVGGSSLEAIPQPELVFFDEREDFLIGNGVLMAYDEEFLAVFHQLRHILSEERKWRIGYYDVGLL